MPVKIKILCPYHYKEEDITIPDSYTGTAYSSQVHVVFEGDVPCGGETGKVTVHMKIRFKTATEPWVESITK